MGIKHSDGEVRSFVYPIDMYMSQQSKLEKDILERTMFCNLDEA